MYNIAQAFGTEQKVDARRLPLGTVFYLHQEVCTRYLLFDTADKGRGRLRPQKSSWKNRDIVLHRGLAAIATTMQLPLRRGRDTSFGAWHDVAEFKMDGYNI